MTGRPVKRRSKPKEQTRTTGWGAWPRWAGLAERSDETCGLRSGLVLRAVQGSFVFQALYCDSQLVPAGLMSQMA